MVFMALQQSHPIVAPHQASEAASRHFPMQRISVQRGIYEYLCTFFLTIVILGGLMVAVPSGIEALIIKLFQGQSHAVQQVIENPLANPLVNPKNS